MDISYHTLQLLWIAWRNCVGRASISGIQISAIECKKHGSHQIAHVEHLSECLLMADDQCDGQ